MSNRHRKGRYRPLRPWETPCGARMPDAHARHFDEKGNIRRPGRYRALVEDLPQVTRTRPYGAEAMRGTSLPSPRTIASRRG